VGGVFVDFLLKRNVVKLANSQLECGQTGEYTGSFKLRLFGWLTLREYKKWLNKRIEGDFVKLPSIMQSLKIRTHISGDNDL